MAGSSYRERNAGYITHSKLSDFLHCPMLYKLKYVDGIVPENEDNEALVIGSAFDLYMRDQDGFEKEYEIVARRSDSATKIQLTKKMGETVTTCAAEFRRQPLYNPSGQMQYEIEIEWNGEKIKGTLDEFDPEKKLIIDDKTTSSLPNFRNWIPKYKRQLAFYQWLVEIKHDIRCAGILRVVTKEDIAKSDFFFADEQSLLPLRDGIIQAIDALIEANRTKTYKPATIVVDGEEIVDRSKCLTCEAYAVCPHSIKNDFEII